MLTHGFPGRPAGGVAIEAHTVAHLAAQHLPDGHAPGLARQIPAGYLDPGNTTAIATKPAVLLDLAEYLRHIARVHADNAALQHQTVRFAAIVPDLAIPGNALVGIQTDEHGSVRMRNAHVGDPQSRWT